MSNNKILRLHEPHVSGKDFMKTRVKVINHATGEVIYEDSNKVIVSGSAFTASKHFNIKPKIFTPTYNNVLGLDYTINEDYAQSGIRNDELVYLFAMGVGGCGAEQSQVYKVDYSKWIKPDELIPFIYNIKESDISPSMREKYFGRKVSEDRVMYYFKSFDNKPELVQQYIDGTPIDQNVYEMDRDQEIESFVQLKLSVSKEDGRNFFKARSGLTDAKVNTISLLTAYPTVNPENGFTYYQDIRPLTKYNFSSASLMDLGVALDIYYDIFY